MFDESSVAVLERTKPLTDCGFRVLVALESVMPPGLTQPMAHRAISEVLPTDYRGTRRGLAELEYHGWIRRRYAGRLRVVDLLYRRQG